MSSSSNQKLSGVLLGGALVLLMNTAHAQTAPGASAQAATQATGFSTVEGSAPSTPGAAAEYHAPVEYSAPPEYSAPTAPVAVVVVPPATSFSNHSSRGSAFIPSTNALTRTAQRPTAGNSATRSTARNTTTQRAAKNTAAKQVVRTTHTVSPARRQQAWRHVESGVRAMRAGKSNEALTHYQRAAQADPNNPYALSGVADNLLILGRYPQAEAAYRRALQRTPGNARLLRGLGDSLVPQRKYPQAISTYKQAANKNPRDFAVFFQLAQVLTWSQRYDEADPYYRRALSLQPRNVEAWTAWGESLSFGRDNRARETFNRALQLRPDFTRALIGLGNAYSWDTDYTRAAEYYRRALTGAPRNVEALTGLGEALTYSSRPDDALPFFQRALDVETGNLRARLGLSRALVQSRRGDEALPHLRQVLAREPRNAAALELLAEAQSSNGAAEATTGAIAAFERLLETQTNPADKAETLVRIAQLQQRAGDFDKARTAYEQAVSLAPNDTEIALTYAQALVAQDQWSEAERIVSETLRRDPTNTRALIMQVAIEGRIGTPERAAALANRLLAVNVANPQDALVLVNALRASGDLEGAQRVLSRLALQADNAEPRDALQIANALRDAGLYDSAQPIYERLIAANPRNGEARFKYAEMLLWQTNFEAAQQQSDALLENEPNNSEARILAATIALRRDEKTGIALAEQQANEVLARDSRSTAANILLGQVQSLRQRYSEAVATYRKTVEAEPNNLEARIGLARNLYYARQTPEAIEQYRELVKRAPADNTIKLELAKIYLDQNQLSDAESLYSEVLASSRALLPPVARGENGVTYKSSALLSPSLRPLRGEPFYKKPSTLQSTPKASVAKAQSTRASKARLRLTQAGANDAAAPTNVPALAPQTTTSAPAAAVPDYLPPADNVPADNAPAVDNAPAPVADVPNVVQPETVQPEATVPETIAPAADALAAPTTDAAMTATIGLGEVRRRQGRYDEAIDYFNRALETDSGNVEARVGLARSLRGKGDYLRSLQEAERVLAVDEANLDARVLRAQLLADTGENARAQQELDALVAGLPDLPTLENYLDLATAFNDLNNYNAALGLLEVAKENYPERVEVQHLRAETLTFARRWDDALTDWNRLIELDPQDVTPVIGKARVYNYSNRLTEAETNYRRALELDARNYSARVELADVLARQSDYPGSIALYREVVADNPGDLKARVELARVLRYNRNFTEAEALATNIIATDPRFAPAYTERSLARSALGNYEEAVTDARRALSITPNDTLAQLGLAEVLSYTKQFDESIRLYRTALQREPDNTKARIELAAALSYAGQYDEALRELNTVLTANPRNIDAQVVRADVYARSLRTKEAVTLYRAILQQDSRNLRARVGLAEAYAYNRQFDDSIRVYNELISLDPTNPAYVIAKGRTLGYARRYPQGIAALRPLVAQNPNNTEARLALAEVLTNSGDSGLRREAVTHYQTVMRQSPDNVEARIGLGRVYSYSGRYREAEKTLNEVLKHYPDNSEARYSLAETQRFAGNNFEARENYERVLQREPQNIGARAGFDTVRRVTSPSITGSIDGYSDTNNVRFRAYTVGAQLPTRALTVGIAAQRGTYEDEGTRMRRNALTLLLARNFGALQARLLLSRVNYSDAPDRTLYDLNLQRTYGNFRKRVYVTIAKRDIIESLEAVQDGITAQTYQVGGSYPIGRKLDLELDVTHYRYSDNNSRTAISPVVYYRFKPTNPSLRLGVGYTYDDTRDDGRPYYTPQGYSAFSVLANYAKDTGRFQYGATAAYPITGSTGDDDQNRPAKTLFGYATFELTELVELFINGGIVRSPNFDSNQFSAGATVRF